MVQADGVTATVVYTYTGDGLRVAQWVNREETQFVWDVAAPLPLLLGHPLGVLGEVARI